MNTVSINAIGPSVTSQLQEGLKMSCYELLLDRWGAPHLCLRQLWQRLNKDKWGILGGTRTFQADGLIVMGLCCPQFWMPDSNVGRLTKVIQTVWPLLLSRILKEKIKGLNSRYSFQANQNMLKICINNWQTNNWNRIPPRLTWRQKAFFSLLLYINDVVVSHPGKNFPL